MEIGRKYDSEPGYFDAFRRMLKKTAQQGRSERESEAYFFRYVELLSDARTKLEVFFSVR